VRRPARGHGLGDREAAAVRPPVGCRFQRAVIAVAVRWYLRYGLSCGDVEELLV
jgi:transposase-like protein